MPQKMSQNMPQHTSGPAPPTARRREVVSYDPRAGRLTPGQRRAWDRWWPSYGRDADALIASPDAKGELAAWFGSDAPMLLEIGSGMGESTVAMAAAAPQTPYLAIDVYQPGLAQLLMRLQDACVTNLRLLRGDAVPVLRDVIEPGTLAGIRIFFPDPWPKQRHHKRRLVQPEFVRLAAERLVVGGTLHLATDWAEYAEHMRAVCTVEPLLRATGVAAVGPAVAGSAAPGSGVAGSRADGVVPRPSWRPVTKFEQRARTEGRPVQDLLYERVPPVS